MKMKCLLQGHDKAPELRVDKSRKREFEKKYHYHYCKDCGKRWYE